MESAVVNPRDLRFQLFEVLDADALCARARYRDHDRESLEAALDLAIQIADEVLWPNAPVGDRDEPRLENGRVRVPSAIHEGVAAITDAGFTAAALDYDRGGMQLPAVLLQACLGVLKAADSATAGYPMLTKAAANLLDVHGTDEQKRLYMEPLYAGRFMGTMCLSEPDVAPRWATSDAGRFPPATAATGSPAARCGFRAATRTSRRTSSIWFSRSSPTRRPA